MEDDKKKKRNKKKKNKQTKTTSEDDSAVGVDENGASNGKNDYDQTNISVVQNGAARNADVGSDKHQNNGTQISILTEAEKQQWLQRESILKQTIKQLQNEKDSHMQKEAMLEERIKLLEKENDSRREQQAMLEGTLKQLRNVNDSAFQKEATLKATIQQLKNENDSHMQKEAGLEKKILQLQDEKELILQKEAGLEEKLQHLLDEKVALGLIGASLEEKIKQLECDKDSWTLTENTTKETIARMKIDMARLRMQVVELEESRNSLLKEDQQLKENISGLQLQLQSLETSISSANTSDELKKHASEHEDLNSQIEAACALVDKLIIENADLVEKVNELYIKLDRQSSAAGLSSAIGSDVVGNAEIAIVTESIPESSENISAVGHKLESLEAEPAASVTYDAEANSGEIVQIPLDDNELRDLELQAVETDKMEAVPLSDAPLIGASFRLISFFTNYVSGADLVDKNTSKLGS